jgi:C4-dicarboxylate transporter DctM subunit
MATPPVGIALFATCGIANISIEQLTRKILPFLVALIAGLLILAYVPVITTFLPRLLF